MLAYYQVSNVIDMETKCIRHTVFRRKMIVEVATARRIEMGGRNIVKKRTLDVRCADPVPASHERTRTIDVPRKSRWLEKMEKGADQLPHKTGNDPTAGSPIVVKRALSSDGRCHGLIVWAWKNGDV